MRCGVTVCIPSGGLGMASPSKNGGWYPLVERRDPVSTAAVGRTFPAAPESAGAGEAWRGLLRRLLVRVDRFLQVVHFVAREQADLFERRELLLGAAQIAHQEIGLAEIFARAAVARIELDRAAVVLERGIVALQVAVRVAEPVLQVRIVGIAALGLRKARDRILPALLDDRFLAGRVIGIAVGGLGLRLVAVGEGARRECTERHRRAYRRGECPHRYATAIFALITSGRLPSDFAASCTTFA